MMVIQVDFLQCRFVSAMDVSLYFFGRNSSRWYAPLVHMAHPDTLDLQLVELYKASLAPLHKSLVCP